MFKCKNECPVGKFDGCCVECMVESCERTCTSDPKTCNDSIREEPNPITGEPGLQTFQINELKLLQKIAQVVRDKKRLEEEEKTLKEKLKEAMEQYAVKKYSSDILNITYIAATTETRIDSKLLKEELPDVYGKYSKTSPKSAYIKIEVK